MPQKQISQYLFERIKETGVDCTFGIPGDFVFPVYAAQEKSGLHTVVMTHEPSIGFAAAAYARIKGLGVALVTYGAGGLNMVNSVALAYAEELPLLVISGGPEVKYRSKRAFLHHCVKTFDTQNNVYEQVTAANAIIDNAQTAKHDIDNVLETVLTYSRPGYLEMPRDLVNVEIETAEFGNKSVKLKAADPKHIQYLIQSICERINNARQAVIMTGVQISRFALLDQVCKISEVLNIPVISSLPGKSAFPESHPNFIGVYYGQFGDESVQKLVESSDCIIALGSVFNEIETGGFTAMFPVENLILINNEEITIGRERNEYDPAVGPATIQFKTFLSELSDSIASGANPSIKKFTVPAIVPQEIDRNGSKDNLTVAHIIAAVNDIVDENTAIVCDVGDCLYAGMSIKTDFFIAPGYYCTMGFGVPASIGVQLADKKKRPLVLVGDGAFQMTGTEISTAVKERLNPIIVIFNNASYAMLKFMDINRGQDYYKLPNWDYVSFARALGAEGYQAQTRMQFDLALQKALKSEGPVIIDAQISPDDISPTLRRMTEFFGNRMPSWCESMSSQQAEIESGRDDSLPNKNSTQRAVLVEGNLWHAIWVMSWPLLLLMIGNAIVGVVDINLAQIFGASAQAAVGVSDQIVFFFVALILSVSIGTNALVSRAFGARDRDVATHTQGQALSFVSSMGLILAGCVLLFARHLMHLITPDEQVAALSKSYLIIYAFYFIPFSFLAIVNAGFRADGDAKTPLIVVLTMTFFNVVGDFWFVYGPLHKFGINGLAWAGFISSAIGALVAWYKLNRSDLKGSMNKLLPIDKDVLIKLVKISVPAAMQRIAWNFSVFALFYTLKHCPSPTAALAAWTIGIRVESFLFMPMFALGQAVSSIVGQNLGAKEDERAFQAGWNVSWLGFGLMLVCGLLLFVFSPQLASFMTSDPDSISYTISYLQICALAQPLQAMAMIFNGALQGAGDTKVPMWITIGTHWLIRQPLAWILAITYALGPKGVWIAMAFSSAASGVLNFWRYQSRAWERLKL